MFVVETVKYFLVLEGRRKKRGEGIKLTGAESCVI